MRLVTHREQLGTVAYPVGMHSPGFIADTDEQAKDLFYPAYKVIRNRIGALLGWPPSRRSEFDSEVAHGSLYIGSPETVARKIARAAGGSAWAASISSTPPEPSRSAPGCAPSNSSAHGWCPWSATSWRAER